jgi:hypothetical protein
MYRIMYVDFHNRSSPCQPSLRVVARSGNRSDQRKALVLHDFGVHELLQEIEGPRKPLFVRHEYMSAFSNKLYRFPAQLQAGNAEVAVYLTCQREREPNSRIWRNFGSLALI